MEKCSLWNQYDEADLCALEDINREYRRCLDAGKTERECVSIIIELAERAGYIDLKDKIQRGDRLKTGDKIYASYAGRAIVLFQMGEKNIEEGMNILGAHIDSPRIDLKQCTLYESEGFAYFDTHYYGGIKKYQWLAQPLALHGLVVKKNGEQVDILIGEDITDPVVVITDLLPHLAAAERKISSEEFVKAENMDLLIGNRPVKGKKEGAVKKYISELLKEKYGIEEEDFISAELEIVPAGRTRECGIDRSMILGYGQDDRVCAFTSLFAMLKEKTVGRTSCCVFIDKEEIGSVGASGMTSRFFENMVAEVIALTEEYSELKVRRTLANSKMLSSDVSAGFDPMYADVYEKRNAAYLSCGLVFNKYTGKGGKNGSNDANPEYIAQLRRIMEENHIQYQTAELGKVDVGGGGTIAYLCSSYGMEVIDSGIAVLSMHAPWEVTSKADIYEAVKGYSAFLCAKF